MRNAYFKLESTSQGFGVRIIPAEDGGEGLNIGELLEYLGGYDIKYDLTEIKKVILSGAEGVVELNAEECPAISESFHLVISDDNMKATVRFYPESSTGSTLSTGEFRDELSQKQVVSGIREDIIDGYFKDRHYCTDYVVAVGKEPRHGTDAKIEYFFNTNLCAKPTLQEDGSVDFFHLNTINHCKQDDVLARYIPADPGECGENIKGAKLMPRQVKKVALKGNHNTRFSEDNTELISCVSGHVVLVDGKVFVSDVYEVENVDISTGDIEYDGSVEIHGSVSTNFSVKTKGDIVVDGVVEGAFLDAGGDIIIARGMNGMSKGTLKAGGNVVAKFIENATVTAAGYVSTESILHSQVMAGTEVTVEGKHGFIVGGRVSATNGINVKTLGSPMGATTLVEVGVDPTLKIKYQENQKQVAEVTKVIKSLEPIILSFARRRQQGTQLQPKEIKYLKSLLLLQKKKQQELKALTDEQEEMRALLGQQKNASVVVTGEVYQGTRIAIADVSTVVQETMKYCKFMKLQGDVKMVGI